MPEPWTGELIGKMHNADVTYDDLAAEIGCGKAYISMIINSRRNPPGAREKLFAAFDAVLKRREETKDPSAEVKNNDP